MICSRCGTEHDDPNKICPRCGLNRPKIRKKWPKWAKWTTAIGAPLLAIGLGVWIFFVAFVNVAWLGGTWEGGDIYIEFNESENTFFLGNGDQIFGGTYSQTKEDFTLTAEDGTVYIYRYERVGIDEMKLTFTQEGETRRVTLYRVLDDQETQGELGALDSEIVEFN